MRKTLVEELLKLDDKNTYFLTADVGYNVLEPLQKKMGDRFINVGLAEQSMIGVAAGLALVGKKVYTYTMCAFYLRAFEQIRNDICYQDLPITLIGVGTGMDYGYLGTTHFATEDADIIARLSNIDVVTPSDPKELIKVLKQKVKSPLYLRLGYDHNQYKFDKYPKEAGSKDYLVSKYHENKQ